MRNVLSPIARRFTLRDWWQLLREVRGQNDKYRMKIGKSLKEV